MKIKPRKQSQANQRAACVRELRRWRQRKGDKPNADKLVDQLQARFPGLPLSKRSLFRWDRQAGDDLSIDALSDLRGGSRVHGWTVRAASITRRWWVDRGSSIRPNKAEQRIVARLKGGDENRHFAQHRIRIARAVLDLSNRSGLPVHTAARHLIACLRSAQPGFGLSTSAAVRWARLYREQGAVAVVGLRFRRPAGSPWEGPK